MRPFERISRTRTLLSALGRPLPTQSVETIESLIL
jgi:hypothetical protein